MTAEQTESPQLLPIHLKFAEVRSVFQKVLGVELEVIDLDTEYDQDNFDDSSPVFRILCRLRFNAPLITYPYPYGESHIQGYYYDSPVFQLNSSQLPQSEDDSLSFDIAGLFRIKGGSSMKNINGVLVPIPNGIVDALNKELETISVFDDLDCAEEPDVNLSARDYKYRRTNKMPLI